MYVYMYTLVFILYVHTHIYVIYIYIFIYTYMHIHVYVYVYASVYENVRIYVYTYIEPQSVADRTSWASLPGSSGHSGPSARQPSAGVLVGVASVASPELQSTILPGSLGFW